MPGRLRGRLFSGTGAVVAVLGGVATNRVEGPWWLQTIWFGVAVLALGAAAWLARRAAVHADDTPQGQGQRRDEEHALLIRVYNLQEYLGSQRAEQTGSRLPGILLNQLLRLQADARHAEGWNPVSVWQMRSGPPADTVNEVRALAPCVMVTGYVERAEGPDRYSASLRVSLVKKDLSTEPLLVEEIEFEDTREAMTAALGDLAERIWRASARAVVAIDQHLSDFLSPDEEASARAEQVLLALGPVRDITNRLAGESDEIQLGKLVSLLEAIDDPQAGPSLVPLLGNEHFRIQVALALGAWGFPEALPVLREQLERERDPGLLAATVEMIRRLGDTSAVPALIPLTTHADSEVRLAAVTGLRGLSAASAAAPALVERLSDDDPETRVAAASALAELGDPSGVHVLLEHVAATAPSPFMVSSPWFMESVTRLISTLPAPAVLPGLLGLLRSDEPQVRGHAAEIAGMLGDPSAVEALAPLISDQQYFPRYCALRALSLIADERCLPSLLQGMRDEHVNCAAQSLHGYVRIGRYRAEHAPFVAPLVSETQAEIRFYAPWLLARWGDKPALQRLLTEVSGSFFTVEDWFHGGEDRHLLEQHRIVELLTPLVPSAGTHDTPSGWAAAVTARLATLTWDGEAFTP
ncbi:HEAT repeat domain-containing protein [Streptomyces sp. NPDC048172]|uniref:HEAT repeat domain-containing protein n=1 Tax=Streptomyces sp. NPDC048172 TaxID=3365505 RepID=UPI003711F3FE